MFRQRYKQANEAIHAPKDAYERLFMPGRSKMAVLRWAAAGIACVMMAAGAFALFSKENTVQTQTAVAATTAVKDYDQLYDLVASAQSGKAGRGSTYGGLTTDEGKSADSSVTQAAPEVQAAPNAVQAPEAGKDYSGTNVQVQGVDEADIVKTDGSYIYKLSDNQIAIIKADGNAMSVASRIAVNKSGESPQATEMFVNGDRLMVISQEYRYIAYDTVIKGGETSDMPPTVKAAQPKTYATVYDISDRSAPKKLAQLSQSGGYLSSRMIGDVVYLISEYTVGTIVRGQPETYVPQVGDETTTKLVDPSNIEAFENPDTASYVVVASVKLADAKQYQSVKAVLGSAGSVYADAGHLVVAASQYTETKSDTQKDANGKSFVTITGSQVTKLILFAIDGGNISEKASASVPGMLHDQFSMDIYKGVFRICTTNSTYTTRIYTDGIDSYEYSNSSTNALYTLDENLNALGSVKDLAPNERIYSVRFDGPVGYFVTFRQVDPLFAVDLSDAKNPKVLSALKIPGFSDYLHVYDTGLLFGFGQAADAESGKVKGLKLSMFDVSDPKNVSEAHSLSLDMNWSEASYNHKAILINSAKSLIAFPAEGKYYIYGYAKDKGFYLKAKVDMGQDTWDGTLRGLFIGDTFYICGTQRITAYALSDFSKLGSLQLK